MKTLLLTTLSILMIAVSAQAEVSDSNYDSRHKGLLKIASLDACGVHRGNLTQLSSTVVARKVDQGITDYYFTTELELTVKIDQGMYDTYRVSVNSVLADGYDQVAKEWGIYSVESASCTLQ